MSTRSDLLHAARELYVREGLQGLSMRLVAERAGVSAPAIYRHFESKEDLIFELCREGHRTFATYLARGLAGKTPRERLVRTGLGYLDFALEHRAFYLLLFATPTEQLGFEKLGARNMEEGALTFQMLVDRVRECMDVKVLAKGDPLVVAVEIWAHVHGLSSLYLRSCDGPGLPPSIRDEASFRTLYAASLDHLLHGLAPR
jgi:AcrR family transcriptional regulator